MIDAALTPTEKVQDLNGGKKQSSASKILQMINPNETFESPCKREVENLTDEEAALFLKLVKLYKNSDFASPKVFKEKHSDIGR